MHDAASHHVLFRIVNFNGKYRYCVHSYTIVICFLQLHTLSLSIYEQFHNFPILRVLRLRLQGHGWGRVTITNPHQTIKTILLSSSCVVYFKNQRRKFPRSTGRPEGTIHIQHVTVCGTCGLDRKHGALVSCKHRDLCYTIYTGHPERDRHLRYRHNYYCSYGTRLARYGKHVNFRGL